MNARRSRLLEPDRQARILRHLREHGIATLAELMTLTGGSESTVRRDLLVLAERVGGLRRTHGGAVFASLEPSAHEPPTEVAARVEVVAKRAIGTAAAALVRDGQTLLLDSGTTVSAVARALAARAPRITVVTNDLTIAQLLGAVASIEVLVTGGAVRRDSPTLYGPPGDALLAAMHVDLLFLGIHAIDTTGLTESSLQVAEMKRRMVAAARRTVLVADHSKFGERSFVRVCGLADVDVLVTDAPPPEALADELAQSGVEIVLTALPQRHVGALD